MWTTSLPRIDQTLYPFHFTCLDAIGHQIGETSIWQTYDINLKTILLEKGPQEPTLLYWMSKTIDASLTHHTLFYRHAILARVMGEEITLPTYPSLYALLASLCVHNPMFSDLNDPNLWNKADADPTLINRLRVRRLSLADYVRQLADREDVTDDRLLTDHGLLSSFSLIYGLMVIYVLLVYQQGLYPTPGLKDLIHSLSDTLAQLKRSVHS